MAVSVTTRVCHEGDTAEAEFGGLAGEFAEEFFLVHAVLEGLAAVNEDDRDLVVVLAAEFGVSVYVNLAPGEAAPAGELVEALFHHLAEMAAFAGIHDDCARLWHAERF